MSTHIGIGFSQNIDMHSAARDAAFELVERDPALAGFPELLQMLTVDYADRLARVEN